MFVSVIAVISVLSPIHQPLGNIRSPTWPSCIERLSTGKLRCEVELKGQGSVQKQRNLRALRGGHGMCPKVTRPLKMATWPFSKR